jgi:fatty-acyl-CoA synthase
VLALIACDRLNAAWLAPVMTTALLTCPDAAEHDLTSLRWVIGGGERTPESRVVEFTRMFTNARYIDSYGLTETCSGDTMMPAGYELTKLGSAGRALMHLALSIRDDDGKELPEGAEGEICLRGPKVTRGYWNDPEKTAAAFFPGSWFRTGDVGYCDPDGFLFITDRKKDMIISGGENIASSEVERAILMLPDVLECAVIGVADERWGERPVAFIVPRPGTAPSEDTLRAHCRAELAGFKVPDRFIIRTGLPRNASGKVLKRELRDELQGGM